MLAIDDIVYIDTRELEETANNATNYIKNKRIQNRQNDVADINFNKLAVERKTIKDFFDSIRDKRLEKQATDMLQAEYTDRYIVIEGAYWDYLNEYFGMSQNHFLGMCATLGQKYRCNIFPVENNDDFWYYVDSLIRKHNPDEKFTIDCDFINKDEAADPHYRMLKQLDGIGGTIAKNILNEYKYCELASLEVKDLTKIPKVGKKKAETILAVLNS